MAGHGHRRSEPTGGEGLRVQHLKQDDATCCIGKEEQRWGSQAWEFPGTAMVPPCQGEGAASTGRAGVGTPVAKKPWTPARQPLQSWFPKEKCLGKKCLGKA